MDEYAMCDREKNNWAIASELLSYAYASLRL
jgi:hypothetical protein